jgi:nucleotide-binding universal stress UspA family protein
MFEKILFPTDFSEVANKTLDAIKKLKGAGAREIIVLHVMDTKEAYALAHYMSATMMDPENAEEMQKNREKHLAEHMASVKAALEKEGFAVKTRIEKGVPFKEILRVQEEEGVTDIVLGSHGVSNVEGILLGSVSDKVIRNAPTPVYVIKR